MAVFFDVEIPAVALDGLALDEVPARVTLFNRSPEPEETDVPLDTAIVMTIADTEAGGGIDTSTVQIFVNGILAVAGTLFQPGFDGVDSAVTLPGSFPNVAIYSIDVTDDFASLAVVTVRVIAATSDGLASIDTTYTFTCIDRTAPKLTGAQATGHRAIRVAFDEGLRAVNAGNTNDALNPANYTLAPVTIPAVTPTVTAVAAVTGTSVFDLTLSTDLTPNASYVLTVTGVEDLKGNEIEQPDNATLVTGYACGSPLGRRFRLWDMIPLKNRNEDDSGTGDLRKFLLCLQEVTDLLLCDIDRFYEILDPDIAPEWALDLILEDLGNPFTFALTVDDKRRLIRVLVPLYKQKGTEPGLKNAIRFFMSIEVAVEPFSGEGMILGESELGEDWELAAASSYSRYSFQVVVDRALTDVERARIIEIVEYMKPANTHFVQLVEPSVPVTIDHLELGASDLGDNWILH